MGAYQDLTPGLTEGLHIGAVIGSRIAQNRLEQQRLDRLFQQTQFANQITLRDQAIQEADAARKAQLFQQQADFSALAQSVPQADTPAIDASNREALIMHLPQNQIGGALEKSQADYDQQQRLEQTLKAQSERTAATQQAYDLRNQARIDERAAEQDKRISAAVAAAEKAQQAAQSGREFTQGEITKRTGMRKPATEEFTSGSPAAIYQDLLKAKESGAESGTVGDSGVFSVATPHWYNSAQPIDTLIEKYSAKVPPAVKRKIEAKVQANPESDQTSAESAPVAEPAADVLVISPKGVRGRIPAAQLDAALKQGYKRAE